MRLLLVLLLLAPAARAERVEGTIIRIDGRTLHLEAAAGPRVLVLDAQTSILQSNHWHSLEGLPVAGLTAEIHLDPVLEQALVIGPELLERADRKGLIALKAKCLRVTDEDRVDHRPTGDYPVWVGLLKKERGVLTIKVDDRRYRVEVKADRDLGWFEGAMKASALKPGMKVVGRQEGDTLRELRVTLP